MQQTHKKRDVLRSEWSWVHTKRYIIVSTIVVMVILHPTLTRQSLFLFMCTDIEEQAYLRKDVQLPCYTSEHLSFCFGVGLPGIIGYVIGTPLLTYWVLVRRKHKLTVRLERLGCRVVAAVAAATTVFAGVMCKKVQCSPFVQPFFVLKKCCNHICISGEVTQRLIARIGFGLS